MQDWAQHEAPIVWFADDASPRVREVARRDMAAQARVEAARRREAAASAQDIISKASTGQHPYLERKGFKAEPGLLDFDGRLIVPMATWAREPKHGRKGRAILETWLRIAQGSKEPEPVYEAMEVRA